MLSISIIVPIYNAERYVSSLINDVLDQSYSDWNLIIIDDGSSDNSLHIAQQYSLKDNRIFVYTQENSGPSSARNLGISKVTTPYVTFIDVDDRITNNYLEVLLEPVLLDNSIDLVCGGYYEQNEFFPEGIALHDFSAYKEVNVINQSEFKNNLFKGLTGVLWAKLFKTSIIKDFQIKMPIDLKLSEDLIFVLRYAIHINKIGLVFENIYYYNRLDEIGLSKKFDKSHFKDFSLFNQLVLNEIEDNKEDVSRILNQRLDNLLLKTLKDQSFSSDNLKSYYELIDNNFDIKNIKFNKSFNDRLFLLLIENKIFFLAVILQKVMIQIRKIKYA